MKKITLLFLTFVMLIAICLSAVGCAVQPATDTDNLSGTLEFDMNEEVTAKEELTSIRLNLNTDGQTTYGSNYVGKTLVATVTPSTAVNKEIEWSIKWADGTLDNIENYYQVVPTTAGSNIAEVRCYGKAEKNAVVTARTVDGGFSATCVVKFVGMPTTMNITSTLGKDSSGYYNLDIGGHYYNIEFLVNLDNIFGYVGNKNCTYEVVSLSGNIKVGDCWDDGLDVHWYEDTIKTVPFSNYLDDMIFSYNNVTNKLSFTYSVDSLLKYSEVGSSDETCDYEKFYSIIDGEQYILTVKVTHSSGLSENIRIKFAPAVTNVSLDQSEIVF